MNRRAFLNSMAGMTAAASFEAFSKAPGTSAKPANVLFIGVDDLRPQLGCYGHKRMVTPHLDKLASRSVLFRNNYCQQAVCSPSRTSLLTGCRPDTTQVYDLVKHFRETLPKVVTLPQHFKNHGYFTEAVGKIYHEDLNDPASWSIPAVFDTSGEEREQYQRPESYRQEAERLHQIPGHGLVYGPAIEAVDAPEENYLDARITAEAILRLRIRKAKNSEPFFLAVGYHKPHLPFVCPKRYWDLYDPNKIDVPADKKKPDGAPDLAMTNYEELRHYAGMPWNKEPLSDSLSRELIHGYYAGVSFTDAQVGRLLQALEEQGFAENTIVVFWVDHGWHLGDHGLWCKHTNFEHATHVPLIIHAPGVSAAQTEALTENVDVYPTLCELAGLPAPHHLEGSSLMPVLRHSAQDWKSAAFSQYPRGPYMGYSMRTKRYRYTCWKDRKGGSTYAEEVYDYQSDPKESVNLAGRSEQDSILKSLRDQSERGWKDTKARRAVS
jgi:iduronate 2-sulfatase